MSERFDIVYLMLSGTTTAARCPEILRGLLGVGFSTVICVPTPNAARTIAPRELADVEGVQVVQSYFDLAIRPRPPDLAETQLPEVLAEVLSFQHNELEDRGITVEAEMPEALPVILADRNQLKQVFFNLIKNAMEAMQPGGALRIRTWSDDEFVFLSFGDTGSGIKQEDLVKLFQPYQTTKAGGSGLGLMIVQRILRAHGGQIGIESKECVGTVVTLHFPRRDRRVRMLQ